MIDTNTREFRIAALKYSAGILDNLPSVTPEERPGIDLASMVFSNYVYFMEKDNDRLSNG